jgi:hypothetical protein
VAELLLELAIQLREDLGERDDWPPDSVGDVLRRMLHAAKLEAMVPPTGMDLADFRSRLAAAARSTGQSRPFV